MPVMRSVETVCPSCQRVQTIRVDAEGYWRWKAGGVDVQVALPALSDDEREALVTGFCPACWDEMFKEEDE